MPQLEPSRRKTRRITVPSPEAPVSPRPPLKWAGGKRWLVPELRRLWNQAGDRRLVEPFCGGLAVALGLRPKEALLNDINPHLINFYAWLKSGLKFTVRMENRSATYYAHRQRFNDLLSQDKGDREEAAALFYYLNRVGYNGLCRFNRRGLFNVPFGRYRKIPPFPDFLQYQPVFREWTFTHDDFESLAVRPDDFIYADPPYDVEFTQYSRHVFGWDEQKRTAHWLARHPGPVVLSNQATPRIKKLYRSLGFELTYREGPRLISCTGDRTPAREVLATRNL